MQNIYRRSVPQLVLAAAFAFACAVPAAARPVSSATFDGGTPAAPELVAVSFLPTAAPALSVPALPALEASAADDQQARPRPVAFEYSDAYKIRAKIHRYASFATLPLFATEALLGQSLYTDTPTTVRGGDSRRSAHQAVGAAIGVLFAANTFTGVWNLWDGRHDPNGRVLRFVHGLLMIAADVGFLATANAVPNRRTFNGLLNYETDKATHRNIAYASIGVATIGYTIMLFGGK